MYTQKSPKHQRPQAGPTVAPGLVLRGRDGREGPVETEGFKGINTENLNVYLRRLDVDPHSVEHTPLDPLHNRAVAQRTRSK